MDRIYISKVNLLFHTSQGTSSRELLLVYEYVFHDIVIYVTVWDTRPGSTDRFLGWKASGYPIEFSLACVQLELS